MADLAALEGRLFGGGRGEEGEEEGGREEGQGWIKEPMCSTHEA